MPTEVSRTIQRAVESDTPRERLEAAVTGVHVLQLENGKWEVGRFVHGRRKRIFPSENEALSYARELSSEEHVDLFVHRNGVSVQTVEG